GVMVALVGVVGTKRLASLPSAVRAQWKIDPPGIALDDTVNAIHDQLRRWPDLTIVLTSAEDEPDFDLHEFGKLDVIVGPRGVTDLIHRIDDVKVGDREHARGQV